MAALPSFVFLLPLSGGGLDDAPGAWRAFGSRRQAVTRDRPVGLACTNRRLASD